MFNSLFIALSGGTPTQMESVTTAMADVFDLVGSIITQIVSQPIFLFLLAAALVPVGIGVFKSIKKAVKK